MRCCDERQILLVGFNPKGIAIRATTLLSSNICRIVTCSLKGHSKTTYPGKGGGEENSGGGGSENFTKRIREGGGV